MGRLEQALPAGTDNNNKDTDVNITVPDAAVQACAKDVTEVVHSPFKAAAQDHWQKAKEHVKRHVALSQAFSTLRDMNGHGFIMPEQLKTVKLLGQGAFATVEAAMYSPAGGGKPYMVAVKKLKMELFRNQDDLDMFVKEVELMRKLRHRNIVEFIGAGEVRPGQVPGATACEFVVQELMAGGTLKQLVTRDMLGNGRRAYTNAEAVDICLQMARGLRYLHKARPMIIHRDLKLENVLLGSAVPQNGQFVVKIADFGLSRRVDAKQKDISLRKTVSGLRPSGSLPAPATPRQPSPSPSLKLRNKPKPGSLGSLEEDWDVRVNNSFIAQRKQKITMSPSEPGMQRLSFVNEEDGVFQLTGRTGSLMYMSPEVFYEQPYGEKADVFSFGMMVYEVLQRYIMLSAVAVRGTYDELEAYCARVAAGYRPPLHEKWPPSIKRLIQDCWAQDPASRPSMDEVVTRLEAIQLAGEVDELDKAEACCCTIC